MKIDPNAPAFPQTGSFDNEGNQASFVGNSRPVYIESTDGLTIRQHLASLAMQGMVANPAIIGPNPMCGVAYVNGCPETLAQMAVHQADALIAELNKA